MSVLKNVDFIKNHAPIPLDAVPPLGVGDASPIALGSPKRHFSKLKSKILANPHVLGGTTSTNHCSAFDFAMHPATRAASLAGIPSFRK